MRALFLLSLALCAALPAAAEAGSSSRASIRLISCSPWQEDVGGIVSYESRMRSVPESAQMGVRVDLLAREPGKLYRRVSAGKLNRSRIGASTFRWQHNFEGLRQGVTYRARAVFRWFDSAGRRVRSIRRRSTPCRQPGGPPNLRIARIEVHEGAVEGTSLYMIRVVNRGAGEARGVSVRLRVDGRVLDESPGIEVVAPGQAQTVSFSGPACRKRLRAVVDPYDVIAESREKDNLRTVDCV